MIDGKNLFDQLVKGNKRTLSRMLSYDNIWKIATGEGHDYTTGCLLDYAYFQENYKFIAVDLSKHEALHADPKARKQINFLGNLNWAAVTTMFFVLEEVKETILDFLQATMGGFFLV